jgi:hypothetical protein
VSVSYFDAMGLQPIDGRVSTPPTFAARRPPPSSTRRWRRYWKDAGRAVVFHLAGTTP